MIDEISLINAKIFNVLDNMLRYITHIQNKVFGGVDVIITSDFYQTPLWKIIGSFKILKIMLMHKHQFLDKHMSNVIN